MHNILLGIATLATNDAVIRFTAYICALDVIRPKADMNYYKFALNFKAFTNKRNNGEALRLG